MKIYIGYDPRPVEAQAFKVAEKSIANRLSAPTSVERVDMKALIEAGLYTRPTEIRDAGLWDVISDAPMSTEFAISRFLVPHLAGSGWALFVDGDVMARTDVLQILKEADTSKACMVVKHRNYTPVSTTKMDGQAQTKYQRKNWSSVVLWNCDHPGTRKLTPEIVNSERGLTLHQFGWLGVDDIGELDPKWNWLVGYSGADIDPAIVHFTDGTPAMKGFEHEPFADEWRNELK
jgi:hypothetical protein